MTVEAQLGLLLSNMKGIRAAVVSSRRRQEQEDIDRYLRSLCEGLGGEGR